MNRIIIVWLSFIILSCNPIKKINIETEVSSKEPTSKISNHSSACKRIMYNTYCEYVKKAGLRNEDGIVTYESIQDFKFLFESNARIFNDIQIDKGESQLIDPNYYGDLVLSYMSKKGVLTEFDKPDINSFFAGTQEQYKPRIDNVDKDDFIYYYSYQTIKKTYNILNNNNQVLVYEEPMIYNLEITFRISIKNESADIVSIIPIN